MSSEHDDDNAHEDVDDEDDADEKVVKGVMYHGDH